MDKKPMSPAIVGVVLAVAVILLGEILKVAGMEGNKGAGAISYLLIGGGLVWAGIAYSNARNNYVTFGQVFGYCFKATAAMIAIVAVYSLISVKFIDPGVVDRSIAIAEKEMEKNPNMTDENREMAVNMTRNYFLPFLLGGIILGFGFVGLIGSLIAAAVAKKKPVDPFQQNVNPAQPL